jgi:hypothetical protein
MGIRTQIPALWTGRGSKARPALATQPIATPIARDLGLDGEDFW